MVPETSRWLPCWSSTVTVTLCAVAGVYQGVRNVWSATVPVRGVSSTVLPSTRSSAQAMPPVSLAVKRTGSSPFSTACSVPLVTPRATADSSVQIVFLLK